MRFKNTPRRSPTIHIWCQMYYYSSLPVSRSLRSFKTTGFFIAGVFITGFFFTRIIRQTTSSKHFLTWWPWPLTYDLDLWTWPRYPSTWPTHQRSGLYVCPFSRESVHRQTDRHTHTHTDYVKTITPIADAGCKEQCRAVQTSQRDFSSSTI